MRVPTILRVGFTAVAGLGSLSGALAWGAAGHEITATIAQIHLDPRVLPVLCSILYPDSDISQPCNLASVASWADKIRYRARWSAPLHYVGALGDHPSDTCMFPGTRGWAGHEGGNVLSAIRNVTTILDDFVQAGAARTADDTDLAQEALKFLIHFVGDMHQPLHLTGRDRGGNGVKVSWDGRVTNLHSLWDGLLIAKALRSLPRSSNYSRPLPVPEVENALRGAIYDPYIRKLMWEGVGVGPYSQRKARWEDDAEGWLACPTPDAPVQPSSLFGGVKQAFLGLLPRRTTPAPGPPQTTDDDALCPYAWAAPLHKLNCDLVWPKELDDPHYRAASSDVQDIHLHHGSTVEDEVRAVDMRVGTAEANEGRYLELDTPEYAGRIEREWVVEKLLAMGGVRLAAVLNGIFIPFVERSA
ncbi:phospholipase C/P1 nuclease [Auriscalpium vulgare]|uniref:Phospholipase C/P1 nuclease n=1 Tax=Auriscalpium vulgare TaxID=40419 RepID=A0ACB8S707_9AGAM|nr:phospholipase C/P1 nuclease [Auriscalpium vulgare]